MTQFLHLQTIVSKTILFGITLWTVRSREKFKEKEQLALKMKGKMAPTKNGNHHGGSGREALSEATMLWEIIDQAVMEQLHS